MKFHKVPESRTRFAGVTFRGVFLGRGPYTVLWMGAFHSAKSTNRKRVLYHIWKHEFRNSSCWNRDSE